MKKVPKQFPAEINLNLSACYRLSSSPHKKLNKCRFRTVSYSPVTVLIAEHLTEANMVASFPGQLNYPSQLIIITTFKVYIIISLLYNYNQE